MHTRERRLKQMGVSHRKEQEKEIRRNDIIDAGEEVFLSKG